MIGLDVITLDKADIKQLFGHKEHGLDHLVELQISLDFTFVQIEAFGSNLLGEVAPLGGAWSCREVEDPYLHVVERVLLYYHAMTYHA